MPCEPGDLSDDRLQLLGMVRCNATTLRQLRDETKDRLYDLWEQARDDIWDELRDEQDPAQRMSAVPKAQRDGVQLLLSATRLELSLQEAAIEALQVPWPPTVSRSLRQIVDREDASSESKAEQIANFVRLEGLRPPKLPTDVPVTKDDIHLVCYQVIEP